MCVCYQICRETKLCVCGVLFLFRVDSSGTICEQRGIFRTNCIDCLDRTNVVQSAIARVVLEIQVTITARIIIIIIIKDCVPSVL